jgi:endonuclease/exonuclease/phosphatase family metal-dependent hydrolase
MTAKGFKMNKRVALSIFRYVLSLFLLLVLILGIFIWWALGTTLPKVSSLPLEEFKAVNIPLPKELTVVSYNIGHGQGIKEQAWDYRNKETTIKQLNLLADAMEKMDADIFFLQEVDRDSHRTFRIDELEFIRSKTKHAYYACANVWEKNYLPFPYWPPSHHLGYIRAANCILSRFPLSNHERIIFDKPESNPFWYNWGYIDRGIERVDVTLGDQKIALLNIHLEAWERKAREDQIQVVANYVKKTNMPAIIGGDFNTVMPDSPKLTGFLDDKEADFSQEKTFPWFFANSTDLTIPALKVSEEPHENFTFPSDNPDRRLDHIFLVGKTLSFASFRVVKEAGVASDHLPVMAKINYRVQ